MAAETGVLGSREDGGSSLQSTTAGATDGRRDLFVGAVNGVVGLVEHVKLLRQAHHRTLFLVAHDTPLRAGNRGLVAGGRQ